MAFKFTLKNSTISDSSIFSNANGVMEDAEIVLTELNLTNTKLFTDINISNFCSSVENERNTSNMSQAEYNSIQNVLQKRGNRKAFVDALFRHLLSFSEGVAASIVANCLGK